MISIAIATGTTMISTATTTGTGNELRAAALSCSPSLDG